MLFLQFKNKIDELQFKIVIQRITIVVLAVGLIINSFTTYLVYSSKRTIITPSSLNTSLSISDIDLSPETLKVMIYGALDLLLSYQQSSIQSRYETFLRAYAYPSRVKEIRESLRERLREIQKLKMSQSFEPENFRIIERGMVVVSGRIIPSMMGQSTKPEPIYVRIEYRIVEGSVKILSFLDLSKTEYTNIMRRGAPQSVKEERNEENRLKRLNDIKRKERLKTKENEGQYQFDPNDYPGMNLGDEDETVTPDPAGTAPKAEPGQP